MANFVGHLAPELLMYAKQLEEREQHPQPDEGVELPNTSSEEIRVLMLEAKNRQSQRLLWFQGPKGTKLRLM